MKKVMITCAFGALVLLASCVKNEAVDVNNGSSIRFRSSVNNATRANVVKLANLNAFNVTAYDAAKPANYFTNLAVSSTDAGITWKTASIYYWPAYNLNFVAYAPAALSSKVTVDKSTQKLTGFTPETKAADQKDVVVAFNTGNKAANEAAGVPLNFKHILSQIEVKAKCSNANMKIEVIGVKICQIPSKGDFTFPVAETTNAYTIPAANWANLTENKDFVINSTTPAAPVELGAAEESIMFGDNNFMLIPQQLTKWTGAAAADGAYISVLCRISSMDGGTATQLFPATAGKFGYSAVPIDTKWEAGKKYIYTLDYCAAPDGGAGATDPDPKDPTNPTNPDVDTNPIPGEDGGTQILGKPIKFTVTVEEWTDTTVAVKM